MAIYSKGRKVENIHEKDRLSFFKAGLWRLSFYAAKNGNIFSRTNGEQNGSLSFYYFATFQNILSIV